MLRTSLESHFNLKNMRGSFLNQIMASMELVSLHYNNSIMCKKALSKIPLIDLKKNAEQNPINSDPEISLLRELIVWFKTSFFEWVDTPKCFQCGALRTEFKGLSDNPRELVNTTRVEVYQCVSCGQRVLFPRYSNPGILLDNPRGRCGEWASTFTLMCISVGLDARYVQDSTDHVWTEVYSNVEGRWIHCDPCEGTIDTPLMYEAGWRKQLAYIIAFSAEEIQDVTWRYTQYYDETLMRRTKCDEKVLTELILHINKERQRHMEPARFQFILLRRIKELLEFLIPPVLTEEYGGRKSGSISWRIQRNEYQSEQEKLNNEYVWTPDETEISSKCFCLKYCTATDKYVKHETNVLCGWREGVYQSVSVFRKIEHDWNMTYLCRTEGSSKGYIKWKFDLLHLKQSLKISGVKINYTSQSFNNGLIKWSIESENNSTLHMDSSVEYFYTEDLNSKSWFILTAVMSQGVGKEAWQHAQILRQDLCAKEYPLIMTVMLAPLT